MDGKEKKQKKHQQKHSGPKAEKKKAKKQGGSVEEDERKRNPKAFAVQSAVRMAKTFHRFVSPDQNIRLLFKSSSFAEVSIFLQSPGPENQKTPHPSGGPDAPGAAPGCDCGCRTPQGWEEHPDPLPDQKLHQTEAWRHLWTRDHRVRLAQPLLLLLAAILVFCQNDVSQGFSLFFSPVFHLNCRNNKKQINVQKTAGQKSLTFFQRSS